MGVGCKLLIYFFGLRYFQGGFEKFSGRGGREIFFFWGGGWKIFRGGVKFFFFGGGVEKFSWGVEKFSCGWEISGALRFFRERLEFFERGWDFFTRRRHFSGEIKIFQEGLNFFRGGGLVGLKNFKGVKKLLSLRIEKFQGGWEILPHMCQSIK